MTASMVPTLEPGRVYRTRDLQAWGAHAPRLARRLVKEGKLRKLAYGLYLHPKKGRFGPVPPTDQELMRAFLRDEDFVFSGPERWNPLGLGATGMLVTPLVYNRKRSGVFTFEGRQFRLRRVAFPKSPPLEWFVVDLFEHAEEAGVSRTDLVEALKVALGQKRFDRDRLREMVGRYASGITRDLVEPLVDFMLG